MNIYFKHFQCLRIVIYNFKLIKVFSFFNFQFIGSEIDENSVDENNIPSSEGDLSIEQIDENNTPLSENEFSLEQIDENDPPSSKDESSPVQKCDPQTKTCSVPGNSANKISYSKLAGFLRSRVKVTLKTTKETRSPNKAQENSPENAEFCSNNDSNETGKVLKFPTAEVVDSSLSDGYTIEEIIDPKAPKRVSSITLFRSNTSEDSSVFKKKILFLKSTKSDSPNRTKRKKDKVCF